MDTSTISEGQEQELPGYETPSNTKESLARNLTIAVCVVILSIFGIYLVVSSSIKSSKYKNMDLSALSPTGSVAGASVKAPPSGDSSPATVKKPAATATPTHAPTSAPTSAPAATSTPNPTNTPTPQPTNTPTPTPTDTPTPTPTETPTPTPTPTE